MKNKTINFLILMLTFITIFANLALNFQVSTAIFSLVLSTIVFCVNKILKNTIISNSINVVTILIMIISIFLNSFNGVGILLFLMFILLFTVSFMVKSKYKFEIALPISISILILVFILFGLFELLKYSYLIVILISLLCIFYLSKNKSELNKTINDINKLNFIIFLILFMVSIIGGIFRRVHSWDEYSYWGYAAKVLIDKKSFSSMASFVGTMDVYPPVSSIWHYMFSMFSNFSESYLYMGLVFLDFIYMMPVFLKTEKNKKINIILLLLASFGFPLLLNGSISYSLLYVDLLLGMMAASALIIHDYAKENGLSNKIVYVILIVITLLKPNGFVVSCCLLFLFYMKNLIKNGISFKQSFIELKKYVFPILIVIISYLIWRILASYFYGNNNSYIFTLIPKGLSSSISLKLNLTFIVKYFYNLVKTVDETIIYSFIPIPLLTFLTLLFVGIYKIEKQENKQNSTKNLIVYLIFYFTFYMLTAMSLFVMFTYYEASSLASFARYLNAIHIGLALFVLYKFSYVFKKSTISTILYVVIILLTGFSNLTYFMTDARARKESIDLSYQRSEKFNIVNDKTNSDSKIFVINQKDEESIMPLWYARYYCYPRIINANPGAITWKIRTKSNKNDLKKWGLNKETFIKHLRDYKFDYLYFYTTTNELNNELSKYFDDYTNIKDNSLFKINYENNSVHFELIKESKYE